MSRITEAFGKLSRTSSVLPALKTGNLKVLFVLFVGWIIGLTEALKRYVNTSPYVNADVKGDLRFLIFMVVVIIVIIIGASIYFTITTPAGQTGLAALGLQISNAIAAPFISIGQGIATFFESLFGGIGTYLKNHLMIRSFNSTGSYVSPLIVMKTATHGGM